MQTEQGIDLVPALKALAAGVPAPRIEIPRADALSLADGETSHALFRCMQEAITNAVKHAAAKTSGSTSRARRRRCASRCATTAAAYAR